MSSVKGHFESLFLDSECSDVTLCVSLNDGKMISIPSHRFVLSSRSPVFQKMFESNRFKEGTSEVVNIKVEGRELVARHFIRFFYFGDIPSQNMSQSLGLLRTSHLYQVDQLITKSEEMILDALTPENVCQIYEETKDVGSTSYAEEVLGFISRLAFLIFQREHHLILSDEAMVTILKKDSLNVINEDEVIDALWNWGQWICLQKGISPIPSAIVHCIKDILCHVRWCHVTSVNKFVIDEALKYIIKDDSQHQIPKRRPNDLPSTLKYAQVFKLNEHSKLMSCKDVEENDNHYPMVRFCTVRDLFLVGLELHLKVEIAWIDKLYEVIALMLDGKELHIRMPDKIEMCEVGDFEEKLRLYCIRFELIRPIRLNQRAFYELIIRMESNSIETGLPYYKFSEPQSLNTESLPFIISGNVISVCKFYYFSI